MKEKTQGLMKDVWEYLEEQVVSGSVNRTWTIHCTLGHQLYIALCIRSKLSMVL